MFPKSLASYLSYIDDIALVVSSASLERNKAIIEEEVKHLYRRGKENGVEFDLGKTELLHFTRAAKAPDISITLPDGKEIKLKNLVR